MSFIYSTVRKTVRQLHDDLIKGVPDTLHKVPLNLEDLWHKFTLDIWDSKVEEE